MNFQSIINFFMSPLGFIIIFGVFSTGARMFKSAQEQQAKKRELQQQRVAQRDSLRTGVRTPTASAAQSTADTETKPEWDTQQEQRRERIEALRKQRQAQLEKIREQRQNKASTTPPPAKASSQTQTSSQGMATRPPAQRPLQTTARAKPTPQQRPKSSPTGAPQRAVAPVIAATQQAANRRRVSKPDPRAITSNPIAMSTDTPISQSSLSRPAQSVRSMIRNDLRSAILAKEVLGTPLGLRAPGSDPVSGG